MALQFQQQHGAMLLKYSGISFISGAVNHGFFSGERSLWTAAIGMVLFVLGAWLEHVFDDSSQQDNANGLFNTLAVGSLLSVGLGFFTGGLQHFPDSPARSAWVVPLGFFISVLALAWSTSRAWQRSIGVYTLVLGGLISVSSYGAWQWFERHPLGSHGGHHHGEANTAADTTPHAKGEGKAVSASGLTAHVVSRSIEVTMNDQMRFKPDQLEVQAGETIRFVVHNTGKTTHEMVLGSDDDIRQHADAMKQGAGHDAAHAHGQGAMISLAPGQRGELVVHFAEATRLQIACLVPGHYEAGMRGNLTVLPAAQSKPGKAPAAKHDHSSHQH